MATPTTLNGSTETLRAIVFREGDAFVAQCLELDISAQGKSVNEVVARLELTIEAESALSCELTGEPFDRIPCAPNYYHELWEKSSLKFEHVEMPVGHITRFMVALDAAA